MKFNLFVFQEYFNSFSSRAIKKKKKKKSSLILKYQILNVE